MVRDTARDRDRDALDRDGDGDELGEEPEAQICTECGELTARAGSDSLYCKECGAGPFCEACYIAHGGEHVAAQPAA